jgi:5'-nucleotidase
MKYNQDGGNGLKLNFMNVKRILLTGDDGYDSIGTRILVRLLKNKYQLAIAGTNTQQSGVGGHKSIGGCSWGEAMVDGIRAYWVDGYPADAIDSVVGYFKQNFDLVISGINWGANIGCCITSGTVSAVVRSLNVGLAPNAVAISWDLPYKYWYTQGKDEIDIEKYLDNPGKSAVNLINLSIQNNFWGSEILNINLPKEISHKVKFTQPLPDLTKYYNFPVTRDIKNHTYKYSRESIKTDTLKNPEIDTGAILNGLISITPFNRDFFNSQVYDKIKTKEIIL